MHESSLARQILNAVLERAQATAGVQRVRSVHGWVAESERLSPEALDFHFGAHARGTLAEGAHLDLRLEWVGARCRACGFEFRPEHHLLLCPQCSSTDGTLLGRTGLGVERIEVETAELPPVS